MDAHKKFMTKMEEIEKKRKQLEEARQEWKKQEGHLVSRSQAAQRNSRLVKEVQREAARMRTLLSSPLLPRLLHLKDAYLNSSSSSKTMHGRRQ